MSSPTPTPWAVICPQHGRVYLTEAEYRAQLDRADRGWECTQDVLEGPAPIGPCGEESEWDDENYARRERNGAPMGAAERHAAAELRVARALEHVQRAQDEMDRALQQLSSIRGAAPMGDRGQKVRQAIRSFWYRLDGANRRKWQLDHEPEAASK